MEFLWNFYGIWDFYGIYTGFIEFRWDIYERTKWIEWHFYRIPLRDFMLMGKNFSQKSHRNRVFVQAGDQPTG